MHTLLITQEFPPAVLGGIAYHSHNLAHTLISRGHEVSVLTTGRSDYEDCLGLPEQVGVERLSPPEVVSPRLWFDHAVRNRLAGSELLSKVDIIHSHEYVQFRRLDSDTPTIVKIHFNIAHKPIYFDFNQYSDILTPVIRILLEYYIGPLERRLAKRALAASDARIFVSELARRSRTGDAAPAGNHVVHNGVDATQFSPDGPSPDDRYFLFVGGTQRRKGHDLVRTAFTGLDATVKVAGAEPPDRNTLPNVEYLGYVSHDELAPLYRGATALVHPARYEPFGNVVLESLACGTPVVVSGPDHCGAAEILDGSVATFVEPTARDVARAVREFDAGRYSATDCRALAERYTWEAVAEQTEAIATALLDTE